MFERPGELRLNHSWFNYQLQRSWAKVMFLQASVILSTGGRVSASVHAGIPPPWDKTPWDQTPPRTRPPGTRPPPQEPTHPPGADMKLGQGNVFTGICDSVHRGGGRVSASVHAGIPHPPEQTHPLAADTHPPLGPDLPPRSRPPQTRPPRSRHTLPRTRHPPGTRPPHGSRHTPSRTRPPPRSRHTPPGADTPLVPNPPEANASIWSMNSQYASYWNAFLFQNCLLAVTSIAHSLYKKSVQTYRYLNIECHMRT